MDMKGFQCHGSCLEGLTLLQGQWLEVLGSLLMSA